MKISKRQLKKIIKEEKAHLLSEMPVSKGRGIFSANVDKKNPHLASFAHEIDSVMEHWGYIANVQMFDSGYVGIKIEFTNDQGKPTKWLVVDQPGKVGMEDQSMGYIFFGPSGPIQKSNAWVWEQVPYHGRKFGDVNFRDTDREFAYSAILDAIEEKLASPIKENKMKITKRQLRRIIKEEKARFLRENSLTKRIPDVDSGRMVKVSARPEPLYGFVSLAFDSGYRIALDGEALKDLRELLDAAEQEMVNHNKSRALPDPDNSDSVEAFTKAVPGSERV